MSALMTLRRAGALAGLSMLLSAAPIASAAGAWHEDPALSGVVSGTIGYGTWSGRLWGCDRDTNTIWAYDGTTTVSAGALPTYHEATGHGVFTDTGVYLVTGDYDPSNKGGGTKPLPGIVWSPDGFTDFQPVFSELLINGQLDWVALPRSLVDLGGGRLIFTNYCKSPRMYYTGNGGQDWTRLIDLPYWSDWTERIISHFHGSVYDADHGTLYVMTGDPDKSCTILFCDDLFGTAGLVNDPDSWATRWGLTDHDRTTLDTDYCLTVGGVAQSQETRATDIAFCGDWLYWGEDAAREGGMTVFRAHRTTHTTEVVATGLTGQVRNVFTTSDGRVFILTAMVTKDGVPRPGHDEEVHVYEVNADGSGVTEVAAYDVTNCDPASAGTCVSTWYGTAEAFDRLWLCVRDDKTLLPSLDGVSGDLAVILPEPSALLLLGGAGLTLLRRRTG